MNLPPLESAARLTEALAPVLDELITPALVLDLDAINHNLRATIDRVGGPSRWQPHLKTCKQRVVVEAMLAVGLRHFKVATADELAVVLDASEGHALDVLVAYPLQRAAFVAVAGLARAATHARVSVLADSPAHLSSLATWASALETDPRLGVMFDVDLGMHRTGSPPLTWRSLESVPSTLELRGLHGYDGHLGWDETDAAARGHDDLCALAHALGPRLAHRSPLALVTSGTHSYAAALAHLGLAEGQRAGDWVHRVSPGTIVLSDRRSARAAADIGLRQAAFVATRVISVGPGRATLDAGSKGVAPDVPPPSCAVLDHPELEPQRPSEEHLPCAVTGYAEAPVELGALLWLVPEHVCTTVNLHREAVWIRDGRYAGIRAIEASGHRPRFGPAPIGETRTAD